MPATKQPKIIDYSGPSGAYVVTDGRTVSLSDPSAMMALVDSTLLTGLGYSEKAAEYQQLVSSRNKHAFAPCQGTVNDPRASRNWSRNWSRNERFWPNLSKPKPRTYGPKEPI